MRSLLADSTSEDDFLLEYNAHSSTLDSDSAILGFEPVSATLQRYHPLPSEAIVLLQVFKENVAPVVRILHTPTMDSMFHDAMTSPASLDKNVEALMLAIDYSAVISMQPQQCMELLSLPRDALLDKYRSAVRQALTRADLLRTESIIALQAAVLYMEALRNEDDSRTVWSLTSLVVHIAKSMGLHRDGTAFGLRPFETELRRRLWYHICLLDIRSSEYHGYEPIVNGCAFDTKLPLHINDSDLTPEMESPPPEREDACEMTLCLVRSEYMRLAWKVNYAPSCSADHLGAANAGLGREAGHLLVGKFESRMQERYIRHCVTSEPFQSLTSAIARLMIARSRISVYKSPYRNNASNSMEEEASTHDDLFQKVIEVLEISSFILTNKDLAIWKWHTVCTFSPHFGPQWAHSMPTRAKPPINVQITHVQWNAVAFALSEICSRPPSPDCDRAWCYVCTLFDEWKVKKDSRTGSLWRPIKRLLAKARYIRELQKVSGSRDEHDGLPISTAPELPSSSEGVSDDSGLAGSDWGSSSSVNDMINAFGTNPTYNTADMWCPNIVAPPFPVPDSTWLNNYQF